MSDEAKIAGSTDQEGSILDALSLSNIYAARNYDVLMAILAVSAPEMATALENVHANGKFVSVPPVLDDNPFTAPE